MDFDTRLTALEENFDKLADLFDKILALAEANKSRLIALENPKASRLYSKGQEPKKVSKEPGDREH